MARLPRLVTPLVRRDGTLQPASWDEAIATAAGGLRAIKESHGGQALGMFSCSKATNEVNYLAQKLARTVLGTNNIDSCNRT
jgi:predicted molibdopterin-dependent oxidoreductase YjgC